MHSITVRSTLTTLIVLLGVATLSARAAEPQTAPAAPAASDARPKSAVLLKQELAGIDGKEGLMVEAVFPPGTSSPPHRHDAHVFVYMVSGSLIMQVDGKEPVTMKAGDTFYETPQDIHRVAENPSATEPAKALVLMIKEKGAPATRPADAK